MGSVLINAIQREEQKKTSDEEFVQELLALRYDGEMSAEEMKQMLRDSHHFRNRNTIDPMPEVQVENWMIRS